MSEQPRVDPTKNPLWPEWCRTYEKHHSPNAGWACLGAEVRNGKCHCPPCKLVRLVKTGEDLGGR